MDTTVQKEISEEPIDNDITFQNGQPKNLKIAGKMSEISISNGDPNLTAISSLNEQSTTCNEIGEQRLQEDNKDLSDIDEKIVIDR